MPGGRSRTLLSLRPGRATTSSSCQPTGPLGLLPAFSLPVFSPCLTAPEARSSHTAAIQHFLADQLSTHGLGAAGSAVWQGTPRGHREGDVLGREMGPISLDHQMNPDLEQVASHKASDPPIKLRNHSSKSIFFPISD